MAGETETEVSGLDLLRQPATVALTRYLDDLLSMIGFEAYLWRLIVQADYSHGDPTKLPKPGDPPSPSSAVAQMDSHSLVLDEMVFCRGVNSFLTYLADLITLIYEKYPQKLPSNKQTTYRFCVEHHMAGDLISALAEETVMDLAHQNLGTLTKYFKKSLDLPMFTKDADAANASLCVDVRNIITHNRGIINRFFVQRNQQFVNDLGKRIVFGKEDRQNMLGQLGYCARQLDLRAAKKFGLETIKPEFKTSASASSPDSAP